MREYWLVHPVDRIAIRYARAGDAFAPPEIVELIGELASSAFPGVVIRWQPIIDKLPAEPIPQATPPRY